MLNYRVRKVTISTGVITTIAGTGTSSYSGDNGPATSAGLNGPYGITLDASGTTNTFLLAVNLLLLHLFEGNVYIADWGNHRIRKVTISTDIIRVILIT